MLQGAVVVVCIFHLKIFIEFWPDGTYHGNPPAGGSLCVLMKILPWMFHLVKIYNTKLPAMVKRYFV